MKNHMEKNLDLRVTKTYQSLFRAFAALLSEKKLEDITVNELCELAMIRRATFYKHFSDKFDFFTFFLKELQHSSMMRAAQTADPNDPCTFYISAIRSAFDFMEENACHLARALESGGILNLLVVLDQDELTSNAKKPVSLFPLPRKYWRSSFPERFSKFPAGGILTEMW